MKIFLLFLFWAFWFLNFSTRTIVSPVLPLIEDELVINHAMAGGISSFMAVGYTVSIFLSGLLSPHIGYKKSIVLGFLIQAMTLFSLRFAGSYGAIVVACLFIGLGAGIYLPNAIPILTEIFGRSNWGKAIAVHDTAASASILAVPVLAAIGLRVFGWRDLFVVLGFASVVAIVVALLYSPDPPRSKAQGMTGLSRMICRKEFWMMGLLWVFASGANMGLYNVLPLFLVKEKGFSIETANMLFGVSRVGGAFFAFLAGVLADRDGVKKILFISLMATGLFTIGLSLAQSIPILVGMLVLQATICMAFFPAGLVAIAKLTELDERSAFTGATIGLGVIVGLGLAPFLLGAIADAWSFQVGIFWLGILTTLSCLCVLGLREI